MPHHSTPPSHPQMTSYRSGARPGVVPLEHLEVFACSVPTDRPESDGTLAWNASTIVIVEASAAGATGIGYTYTDPSAAALIKRTLGPVVAGCDALAPGEAWNAMVHSTRDLGRAGIAGSAISAIDVALWDLKARLLDVPLATALGAVRDVAPLVGSGDYCTYSPSDVANQLGEWAETGMRRVKMCVGWDDDDDLARLSAARAAIGDDVALHVDAAGAYSRKQALAWAQRYTLLDVTWFEEPVPEADVEGLRIVRDRAPSRVEVAAGRRCFDTAAVEHLTTAGAVDCIELNVSRCGGFTGLLSAAAFADAKGLDCSTSGAPQLSAHVGLAARRLRHVEYPHDHARVEETIFDNVLRPIDGVLSPDRSVAGNGLVLRRADMVRFAA